jgi:hypothetical protein
MTRPAVRRGGRHDIVSRPRGVSPMRKLFAALVALFLFAGMVLAAEVTFVKFDEGKKELTVKEGDKEKTYKVGDKVDTSKWGKIKADSKVDITTDGNTVTKLKRVK